MAQIRSFGVLQTAKFIGTLYAAVSALFAVPIALIGVVVAAVTDKPGGYAIVLVVFAPLVYGLMGFLVAALGAWAYNALAARIGGIEVEIV